MSIKSTSSRTEREIAGLIETYRQGFLQLDPKLLGSIWDNGHSPLIYVAMEKPEPMHGWAAIKRYYAGLPKHLEAIVAKEVDDVRIDVSGDTAMAFFRFQSTVRIKGHVGLFRPTGRVTMLFRHALTGWRLIHFHESAVAART